MAETPKGKFQQRSCSDALVGNVLGGVLTVLVVIFFLQGEEILHAAGLARAAGSVGLVKRPTIKEKLLLLVNGLEVIGNSLLLREALKLGGIGVVLYLRDEGGSHRVDVFPVDSLEPGVLHDSVDSQATLVVAKHAEDEVLHLIRSSRLGGETQNLLVVDDAVFSLLLGLGVERGVSKEGLIEDDSDGPNIYHLGVLLILPNLRSHVVGSTNEGLHAANTVLFPSSTKGVFRLLARERKVGSVLEDAASFLMDRLHHLLKVLAETKVGELDVTIFGDQEVVGLEIAVHNVVSVQLANGDDKLRDVEAGLFLGEGVVLDENVHVVSAGHEFHDQVEVQFILERKVKGHNPIRVCVSKYVSVWKGVMSRNVGGEKE